MTGYMFAMARSEAMREICVHREAELARQLNIETTDPGGDWVKGGGG